MAPKEREITTANGKRPLVMFYFLENDEKVPAFWKGDSQFGFSLRGIFCQHKSRLVLNGFWVF